jgi:hypothetical protein
VLILTGAMIMSQVFNISIKFHINMKITLEQMETSERDLLKMKLRSMAVLKCQIGSFYYMESKAKLMLADNIASGVAAVLHYSN